MALQKEGEDDQHFNIAQNSSNFEVNVHEFSPNYHAAIFFELRKQLWSKEIVISSVTNILTYMDIESGSTFEESIAPMFKHEGKEW